MGRTRLTTKERRLCTEAIALGLAKDEIPNFFTVNGINSRSGNTYSQVGTRHLFVNANLLPEYRALPVSKIKKTKRRKPYTTTKKTTNDAYKVAIQQILKTSLPATDKLLTIQALVQ